MHSSAHTVRITKWADGDSPFCWLAEDSAPCEKSSKDNIGITASQHVLLLSLCGKHGALIIIK